MIATWLVLFTGLLVLGMEISARFTYPENGCEPQKLTVYRVLMRTNWDREVFPKQYPEWRPPAQWSKLIGRTHGLSYKIFHLGETASDGLKQFAETGVTDLLEDESQGIGGIFDEFNAPAISEGVGEAESEFFVDGNHSRVSFAARIIPSPDWFIGIDSFDLCVEGKWIDSVMLEVDPLDAGTDNGFTFTSPNWPTVPQKPIARITAQDPSHPANSFFYQDRISNAPIASFHIAKVKEYELSRVFSPSLPPSSFSRESSFMSSAQAEKTSYLTSTFNEIESNSIDRGYDVSSKNEVLPPLPVSSTVERVSLLKSPLEKSSSKANNDLIKSLVKKYRKKYRKNRKGRKMVTRRLRAPRDCKVSEYSEWSPCSKTCGIGEQVRKRTILKHARRGGRTCPLLVDRQWCGSSRDCKHKYFDW